MKNSYSDEIKRAIQHNVETHLTDAIETLEIANILEENGKLDWSCRFLKKSTNASIDAVLALNDLSASTDQHRLELWKASNETVISLLDHYKKTFNNNLQFPENSLKTKQPHKAYSLLLHQYTLEFTRFFKEIRRHVKTTLFTSSQLESIQSQRIKQAKRYLVVGISFLVLAGTSLGSYLILDPHHVFYTQPKLYWKQPTQDWSETYSFPFKQKTDHQFYENTLEYGSPIKLIAIRFDPAPLAISEAEVDWIRLYDDKNALLMHFDFNKNDVLWLCHQCEVIPTAQSTWLVNSLDGDPYLVSPDFAPIEVKKIQIRTRLRDKIPFWKWILKLES
ncbi:hypothetical protein WDW89_01115 [Deltaproteobacteria bacterium TL4]